MSPKQLECDGNIMLNDVPHVIATSQFKTYKKYVDKNACPEIDEK